MKGYLALLGSGLVAIAACEEPGEGAKAERGYARARLVVAALDSFHEAHGHFPDSLPELSPKFLDVSALATPTHEQERFPWEYRRQNDEFSLTFKYVGPGMNHCTFTSNERNWTCSGYY